jgi:hypothetical protein
VDEAASIVPILNKQRLTQGAYLKKFVGPSARLAARTSLSGAPYSAYIDPNVASFRDAFKYFRGDPSLITPAPKGTIATVVEKPILLLGGALRIGFMALANIQNFLDLWSNHSLGKETFLASTTATTLTADIIWLTGFSVAVARNEVYKVSGEALMEIGGSLALAATFPVLLWQSSKAAGEINQSYNIVRSSPSYKNASFLHRLFFEMGVTGVAAGIIPM